jgi:hypothetical protein
MASQRIPLTEPVEWFGQRVTALFLRAPGAGHLTRLGEPRMLVAHPQTGARYFVDRDDVIPVYFDELLSIDGTNPVDGGAAGLLTKVNLEDGIALRDALFDFFSDAREALFKRKQTSSSST